MKYSPYLDQVSDIIGLIPTNKAQSVAYAIRVCNDRQTDPIEKISSLFKLLI
ncbi:hypothetical protein [Alkanindiges hydrocarboniclasticus]|uniref:hypothetical protein n=1 Tax=Alkanindiges hydrocarboniclasticus TaxID=1907941 RepID=UPI001300DABD|nr:hypothetical protein [Alkanindiges hydrocarboniclasticus]